MQDPKLRIFSYLPNPRVWKSLIAAAYCNVEIDVRGDAATNLNTWLWDFDARELTEAERAKSEAILRVARRGYKGGLYKSDTFLKAHPFGTVPAAFDPQGSIGIFESNSILRSVARVGAETRQLYGNSVYEASRIDSFLDTGLVFAREAQVFMLSMPEMTIELYDRMHAAYEFYLAGIDAALNNTPFIAGETLSIADIAFACDVAQFLRERKSVDALGKIGRAPITQNMVAEFKLAYRHLITLSEEPEFTKHIRALTEDLPRP